MQRGGREADSISGVSQAQRPGSLLGASCHPRVKISQLSDKVALGPTRGTRVPKLVVPGKAVSFLTGRARPPRYTLGFLIAQLSCGFAFPGEDGPSQMALEDLAMFRSIPNCTIFYPSDATSTEHAVLLAANTKVFLRGQWFRQKMLLGCATSLILIVGFFPVLVFCGFFCFLVFLVFVFWFLFFLVSIKTIDIHYRR